MSHNIRQFVEASKVIIFLSKINARILLYFYNSKTYGVFIKFYSFLKNIILKNRHGSVLINTAKKIYVSIGRKEVGLFIVLVVLFNTAVMWLLKKEIDIFSATIRILFFLIGIVLILKKKIIKV